VKLLVDGEELGGVGPGVNARFYVSGFDDRLGGFFQFLVQRLQFGQFGVGGWLDKMIRSE
jgi:hypothetical protein